MNSSTGRPPSTSMALPACAPPGFSTTGRADSRLLTKGEQDTAAVHTINPPDLSGGFMFGSGRYGAHPTGAGFTIQQFTIIGFHRRHGLLLRRQAEPAMDGQAHGDIGYGKSISR